MSHPSFVIRRVVFSAVALATWLVGPELSGPAAAEAQLATRHYLPPVLAYADSDIRLEITTPAADPVSYKIYSKSGGLESAGASIAAIEGTVVVGSPQQHEFARASNVADASGGIGFTTGGNAEVLEDYGIVVEASAAVTVTIYTVNDFNRDIVASKGSNALGRDFYLWSNANANGGAVTNNNQNSNFFSIMALENGTQVDVTSGNTFANFVVADQLLLDALETVTIRTTNNVSITGSRLRSNKPISVISGDVHPSQNGPHGERDGAVDQLVPANLAGTHYVVGNIATSSAYGTAGVGNRYVQIVGLSNDTEISHYRSDNGTTQTYTVDAGQTLAVPLPGTQDTGHSFRSSNAGTLQPFLLFLNSTGATAANGYEMGGCMLPALRGASSGGSFCSGTRFVELTAPPDTQAFMVYVPTDQLSSLQVDIGGGLVDYDDVSIGAPSQTPIDPDGAGGIDEVTFLRFPGNLVAEGERIAFAAARRMHVAVGTAKGTDTGSFGYFSDYNTGFQVQDPVLDLPTDSYAEPLSFKDSKPRTITHCLQVDSACSSFYDITSIESNRDGEFSKVTTDSNTAGKNPCFDFTPVPVPGGGPQKYVVSITVTDENGDSRDVHVAFTFTWGNDDTDNLPDAIDLDDDNDGISDAVELGGDDLSGDRDLDGVPDFNDPDVVDCKSTDGKKCDKTLPEFDVDGDGIPNHLDLDSDGDGVFDLIEGNDGNTDGKNDASVQDDDGDGQIDNLTDANGNGLDDAYEKSQGGNSAAVQDTDEDGIPDFLDPDDDGDGISTRFEDLDADGDFGNDDTDGNGTPNYLDDDDDGDGTPTIDEAADPNGDGDPLDAVITGGGKIPDYLNPKTTPLDSDNDGIPDAIERPGGKDRDTDGDGIPDHLDPDDDNDGIATIDERGDENRNGVPDYLEPQDAASLEGGGFGCSVTPSRGAATSASSFLVLLALGLGRRVRRRRAA